MTNFKVHIGEGPMGKYIGYIVREMQDINEKIISHMCDSRPNLSLRRKKKTTLSTEGKIQQEEMPLCSLLIVAVGGY